MLNVWTHDCVQRKIVWIQKELRSIPVYVQDIFVIVTLRVGCNGGVGQRGGYNRRNRCIKTLTLWRQSMCIVHNKFFIIRKLLDNNYSLKIHIICYCVVWLYLMSVIVCRCSCWYSRSRTCESYSNTKPSDWCT